MSPNPDVAPPPAVETVMEIDAGAIVPNAHQPRRRFAEDRILRLARSIASQGVVQPVVVRPHPRRPGFYELVAGERRLRALRLLGRRTVPAIVREISEEALLELALVENLQREPLTPIEEAQAYRALIDAHGYTQEQLADRIGKDRSTIANMLRLLSLPASVQDDLEEERMSTGHARALLGTDDPARVAALRDMIVQRGLSVRDVERLVQAERGRLPTTGEHQPAKGVDRLALSYEAARDALENHLRTKVVIQAKGDKGKLEIEYYSVDEFNRLYDALLNI